MTVSALETHPLRPLALALCAVIREACPELTERIRWNAPSFGPGREDRLTLNLSRPDRVRLVLHRGARAADTRTGQRLLPDEPGLTWQTDQRVMVELASLEDLDARRDRLADLCRRWIAATAAPDAGG